MLAPLFLPRNYPITMLFALSCLLFFVILPPIKTITPIGKSSNVTDFTNTITTKAFDRFSGNFYVGIGTAGEGAAAIAKATRDATTFSSLASHIVVNNKAIGGISLLPKPCNEAKHIAAFFQFGTTDSLKIALGDTKGNKFVLSNLLRDAQTPPQLGRRVSHIATSTACVFARVDSRPQVPEGGNGLNSAINTIRVDSDGSITVVQGTVTTPGVLLDRTSQQARHGKPLRVLEVHDMHWDNNLETLFVAMRVVIDPHADNDGFGIVKGTLSANCTLNLSPITTATPIDNSPNTLFAFGAPGGTITGTINIHRIRTMRTTTGFYYLIINGGIEKNDGTGNKVYALPIGSQGTALAGCITTTAISRRQHKACCDCNGNTFVCSECHFFDTPLSNSFSLLDSSCAFTVGAGPTPWEASFTTSNMVVVDDTVYVSVTGKRRDRLNDPGVWASQAQFNHNGIIASWTPWERVFPSAGGGENATADRTPFFAIDGKTGKIWRVKEDATSVERTQWTASNFPNGSLQRALAKAFKDGCFSFLDLPEGTPGIGLPTAVDPASTTEDSSLVLFGGFEKVAFAHTKKNLDNQITATDNYITHVGNITNFVLENFLLTDRTNGLRHAGSVRALGYSCSNQDRLIYFFAGTDNGLFVFTDDRGQGFTNTGIVALTEQPFNFTEGEVPANNPRWQRIAKEILVTNRAVTAIESDGTFIYFVALDTSTIGGIVDKLYQIRLKDTAQDMTPRLIAQSGTAGLPRNTVFSGFSLLTNTKSTCTADAFYGVISTNDGIYTTTCHIAHLRGQEATGNEWTQVTNTNSIAFHQLFKASKDKGNARKIWSLAIVNNPEGCQTFQNSRFFQAGNANGTIEAAGQIVPNPCGNARCPSERRYFINRSSRINHVDSSLFFYSDGARRFFSRFNPDEDTFSALRSLPFDIDEWNMDAPFKDPALANVTRIFWIGNVSATGQLMAGTDTGVIVLD